MTWGLNHWMLGILFLDQPTITTWIRDFEVFMVYLSLDVGMVEKIQVVYTWKSDQNMMIMYEFHPNPESSTSEIYSMNIL